VVVGCGTVAPGAAFTPESFSTRTIAVRAIPSPPGTEETGVLRGPAEQRRHAAEIDRRGNQRHAYRLSGLLGGECVRRQALS
jgi:hypothetical protein